MTLVFAVVTEGRAEVATLQYLYRFDPARIVLRAEPGGVRIGVQSSPDQRPLASTWDAGEPELPVEAVTFLVPRGLRIGAVRVHSDASVVLTENVDPALALPVADELGRAVAPKPAAKVVANGVYPAAAAEACGGGALHGYQLASVRVYPVRWDAATRRLLVTPSLDLEIDLEPGAASPLERQRFSPEIEALARHTLEGLVANPQEIDRYDRRLGVRVEKTRNGFHPSEAPSLEGSDVEYVIVTSQALASTWQLLADWKTRRGVPTVVRTTEWIEANYRHGSDLQETIRTFLKDAYAKWGIRYALLAADTDVIPARFGFSGFGDPSEQSIPTDMYFACLDGFWNLDGDARWGESAVDFEDPGDSTDMYAELFVGRAPLRTTAEVNNFIGKVTSYETPTITDYQKKILMLGEVIFPINWSPGTQITIDGADYAQDILSFVSACVDTVRRYENYTAFPGTLPLTKAAVLADMNAGPGFVDHIGHGFRYNMSCGDLSIVNSEAAGLTNTSRRFILYMVNCTAAAFDFPCLAESYLKATGGAVAVLGATRSAFAVPSRNYNREFFRAVHQNGFSHMGEAFVQSRLPYTPNTFFDTSDKYTHLLYNYLGDPEMVLHTCDVGTTTASWPSTIALGPTNVTVQVQVNGTPRAGALVCLSKGAGGAEAYEFGTTDGSGDATIAFRPESGGSVQLTISGQNMTTLQGTITVTPAATPYVHIQSIVLHDGSTPPANGNNDGALDAGETVTYDITGINDSPVAATGVIGVLRVASPWATATDSVFALGSLAANGGTATTPQGVAIHVAPAAPDGAVLPLAFITQDASRTWTDRVNRVLRAPDVRFVLSKVEDPAPGGNNDGLIQAGETFDLAITLKNYGTGTANGVVATLTSSDGDVTIQQNNISVGTLSPHQELVPAPRFRLSEAVLDENPLTVTITDSYGRTQGLGITLRGPAKPATPALSPKSGANTVFASWTPSTEPDLAGYHVYRSLSASGPYSRVTVDRTFQIAYYLDTNVLPSTKYWYRVTAVDRSGNESIASNFASINTSPPQLSGWPIGLHASSNAPLAVGDVTGDGSKEIVVGAADRLYAWNWNGIELRDGDREPESWGVLSPSVYAVTSGIAMADIDNSPGLEIFCAAWDTTRAYVLRGDGSMLPGWPQSPLGGVPGFWAPMSAIDLDNNGQVELFAPARNGTLYAWHEDGSPLGASAAFKSGYEINIRTSPSFANLDADPDLEIVFATPSGQLNVWNSNGSNVAGFPVQAGLAVYSNPAIGDVNDDGILDIVLLTEGGGGFAHVYNSATATELPGWPRPLTVKASPISPSPALADFDGDGKLEIVVANNGGSQPTLSRLQVFDWQGNVVLGWPRNVGGVNSECSPIVADMTGDGISDILFANDSGFVYGWDWHGVDLPGFPITVGDFLRATPTVDDVDGDGHVNLVLAGFDRNVYVWDFPAAWHPEAAQWPTLKHDVQRSGLFGFDALPPALPSSLSSTSHTPFVWSNDPSVDVVWTAAADPSGIGGYSFVWDTNPTTLPDQEIDATGTSVTSPLLQDGSSYWFHLRAVDTLGHWTMVASHLGPFPIDTTPPPNSSLAVADRNVRTWSNDNIIYVQWNPVTEQGPPGQPIGRRRRGNERNAPGEQPDPGGRKTGGSGLPVILGASPIAGYSYLWSADSTAVPNATIETASTSASSPAQSDGSLHWFHLRTVDTAGNASSAASTLHLGPFWIDTTAPQNPTTYIPRPAVGVWVNEDSIQVLWSGASDAHSGLAGYSWEFSSSATTVPDPVIDGFTSGVVLTPAPLGETWFHQRTRDVAGNWSGAAHLGPFRILQSVSLLRTTVPAVERTWLEDPVPNPFNPTTTLRYSLLETGRVRIAVFDARGRRVRTLVDAVQPGPRWYAPVWNGRDDRGRALASGVYIVRFEAPGSTFARRLVLLK